MSGEIQDVVVDLRKNSKTFGKYVAVELSDENKRRQYDQFGSAAFDGSQGAGFGGFGGGFSGFGFEDIDLSDIFEICLFDFFFVEYVVSINAGN